MAGLERFLRAVQGHAPRLLVQATLLVLTTGASATLDAQQLTVRQIFADELTPRTTTATFLADGRRLQFIEPNGSATDVWVERIGAGRERLIDGTTLIPPGASAPITVEAVDWTDDERRALIYTNSQRVWRLNTRGHYYVWDRASARLEPISRDTGWQMYAKFAPDGAQVAFVRGNNLFVADPFSGREIQLTADGGDDIINGATDWVYEEELNLRDGFRWSPDGRRIAYWRFDQSAIPPFYMIDPMPLYARLVPVRYPKAGTANSRVELRMVDIATGHTRTIDTGDDTTAYLARMEWLGNDSLLIQRLDRSQHRLDVLIASATTGRSRVVFTDVDSAWVEVDDDLIPVRDGRQFLFTSERDGYNHIYLYDRRGMLVRQVTRGEWDVTDVLGLDASGRVLFVAAAENPLERHLYRVDLDGRGLRRISDEPGTHAVELAPGGRYYLDTWSRAGSPPQARVHSADGRVIRVLADNEPLADRLAAAGASPVEFFAFETTDGVRLNGWMIKPRDFDPARRYPVLLYVYGGPGSQTVIDAWGGTRYLWHELLAGRGVVVASVDNRGTGARGRDFRKLTYLELGTHESHDQIEAARYFAAQPWVDPERIGIWGWSYGGYMTALTLTHTDRFRAGIAVAPVTDWRLYDTIYTERVMSTPEKNLRGYDASSVLLRANRLQGRLLLVHGTGDDNVHDQHSLRLIDALQEAGKQFDLMLYPNRTHSISGGQTSIHLFEMMTDWVMRNLAGSGS